jgi:anti-sigma B factor antagonist
MEKGIQAMKATKHLRIEMISGVTVVTPINSQLLTEADIASFGEELYHLLDDEDHRRLVINFAKLEFLSSTAVGKLINLKKKVTAVDGKLKFCCVGPNLSEIFRISALDRIFEIYKDEQSALDTP